MIIRPIDDIELIQSVMFNPVIFDSISEDGSQKYIPEGRYLGGFVGDVCVGVVLVLVLSKNVADVHIHVLPEHRKAHALDFGIAARDWLFDKGLTKLLAQIPFCCENVKNFALKIGFEIEGVNRQRWLKNGQMWDSWYLGMVR